MTAPVDVANVIATVVRRHGGRVEAALGDASIAVFGLERSHETTPPRLSTPRWRCTTAADSASDGDPHATRIGVATGESVVHAADLAPTHPDAAVSDGRDTTGAARGARDNPGRLRNARVRSVRPTYSRRWGADAPTLSSGRSPAYRLLQPSAASTHGLRLETALIGRDRELAMLGESLTRAIDEQSCLLFSLIAPAGTGKSRLIHEFVAAIRPSALVLRGRCRPHGQVAAFEPVAEVLRQAAHATSREAPD